ncbi:selenide, water dikinase SelD [Chryseotalea sanaruensis]|uniref:Selenide, water dikinase n=1 Tax=Chryseotalea sanaruensis TaxID=2482724 RepID=A0A401UBX5_9BACT|nr:selenide, water dikinase SelD [Chryseotalea sanaruensis]GCC52408.1 selenide, water dikinase SelD [Chryseotalea sanaruensis]
MSAENIKLTQYSHGSGCGCKIAPAVLDKILHTAFPKTTFPSLLVGNESKDDAAVMDIGNGNCLISTTDFFMPIVDDAFTFGSIASVNAISDVYAMGGKPIMALAILGWPVEKLSPELAQKVLDGSRTICAKAGIPLAGGHSIDSPEPIFGLAVSGLIEKSNLKQNNTAKSGDLLYLTKPLGVGMISTAHKRGLALAADFEEAVQSMLQLNIIGEVFGKQSYIHAMTDITGFGLLGHLVEVCEGSGLSAEINYANVPLLKNISHYASNMIYPDNTMRNWSSYQDKIDGIGSESFLTLSDPQTSGGLMVCVAHEAQHEFEKLCLSHKLALKSFGRMTEFNSKTIKIIH